MSLGGTFQDHHLEMFHDMLADELQKAGSALEPLVTVEAMTGNTAYFDKIGSMTSYQKTQRAQTKTYQDPTFERRPITFEYNSSDILLDKVDLLDLIGNPESDYVRNMVSALGRQKDEIIFEAMSGTAVKIVGGASSNVSFPSGQKVAVNDHLYDTASGTNDTGLTGYKLKNALKILRENRVDLAREQVFCIAPASQLAGLAMVEEIVSSDYRGKKPLEATPMMDEALSGYLGITFIAYEETGNVNTTDEVAYVFVKSAIKVGVRQPLTIEREKDTSRTGNPWTLSATEDLGAIRFYEEKIVQIACDPTTFKSA